MILRTKPLLFASYLAPGIRPLYRAVADAYDGSRLITGGDWRELEQTFRHLATDDQLRAVVVRGQGGTFSSGSDMREWVQADQTDVADSFAAMEAALRTQSWRVAASADTWPSAVMAQAGAVRAVCWPSRRVRSSIIAAMPVR